MNASNKKGFIKILLVVIAVTVIFLFVYIRMGYRTDDSIPRDITDNQINSGLQDSEKKEVTADWKTYESDKNGFEFTVKYPNDWSVYDYHNHATLMSDSGLSVYFYNPAFVMMKHNNGNQADVPTGVDSIKGGFISLDYFKPKKGTAREFVENIKEISKNSAIKEGVKFSLKEFKNSYLQGYFFERNINKDNSNYDSVSGGYFYTPEKVLWFHPSSFKDQKILEQIIPTFNFTK